MTLSSGVRGSMSMNGFVHTGADRIIGTLAIVILVMCHMTK